MSSRNKRSRNDETDEKISGEFAEMHINDEANTFEPDTPNNRQSQTNNDANPNKKLKGNNNNLQAQSGDTDKINLVNNNHNNSSERIVRPYDIIEREYVTIDIDPITAIEIVGNCEKNDFPKCGICNEKYYHNDHIIKYHTVDTNSDRNGAHCAHTAHYHCDRAQGDNYPFTCRVCDIRLSSEPISKTFVEKHDRYSNMGIRLLLSRGRGKSKRQTKKRPYSHKKKTKQHKRKQQKH
jgi:hypothetical protein